MMSSSSVLPDEVPSPIDFHDLAQAKAWVENTVQRRPWRPAFFEAFADAVNAENAGPHRMLELGCGPGHLAAALLSRCSIERYVALDFSAAMLALAREQIGTQSATVDYCQRDFREPDWARELGPMDVVVTMQAAHEVRHKSRLPMLFERTHSLLRSGGLFLICDHYFEPDVAWKSMPLYLESDAQQAALQAANFANVRVLRDEGGMSLISARKK